MFSAKRKISILQFTKGATVVGDDVETIGSGKVSAMYTSHGVRRAYQALLTSQKIYQNVQKCKTLY